MLRHRIYPDTASIQYINIYAALYMSIPTREYVFFLHESASNEQIQLNMVKAL